MIQGIGQGSGDLNVELINSVVKHIELAQSDLIERMLKMSIEARIHSVHAEGIGEVVDAYA